MSTKINPALTKFRPVLTLEQISYISSLCHAALSDQNLAEIVNPELSASIRRVLVPMAAKIDVGAISPAYVLSPEQIARSKEAEDKRRYENDLMSPEEITEYESKILGV